MTATPTTGKWQRLQRPVAGLALAIILGASTYHAAADLAGGGSMPHARGRGALFVTLSYALAKVLGLRATLTAAAIVAAVELVLIARALRPEVRSGDAVTPTQAGAPRSDVVAAFAGVRGRRRLYDAVQFVAAISTAALAIVISSGRAPTTPEAIGFVVSLGTIIAVSVLEVRAWKCPACGGSPGRRRATVCATCGVQLVSNFEAATTGRTS